MATKTKSIYSRQIDQSKLKIIRQNQKVYALIALGLLVARIISNLQTSSSPVPAAYDHTAVPLTISILFGTVALYPLILCLFIIGFLHRVIQKLKKASNASLTGIVGLYITLVAITLFYRLAIVPIGHLDCADNCSNITFTVRQESIVTLYIVLSYIVLGAILYAFLFRRLKSHAPHRVQ